jgi:hypothetical protein
MLDVAERCSLAKHVPAHSVFLFCKRLTATGKQTAKPFTGHTALRYALTSGRVLSLPNLSQETPENTTRCTSL